MDLNTANRVADHLLKDAIEKQARKARRNAHWATVVERLQTGLFAISFAGIGYGYSQRFFHNQFAQVVVAAVLGLVAGAIVPVIHRAGLTVRRSGRP